MAGGIWSTQNKIRPGAYINFEAVKEPTSLIGSRGIVTMALELDWGAEGELIDVYASDLKTGASLAKVGLLSTDSEAKLLNLALSNCLLCKVYRLNTGGSKATKTIGDLTITAKYSGTFGNKIAILITEIVEDELFQLDVYANGYLVNSQKVASISDLEDNEYVTFSGTGDLEAIATAALLTGGVNGTTVASTAYANYFSKLVMANWQTVAICNNAAVANPLVETFIRQMRDNEGKYVQAVVANYNDANYEGIINNVNGVVMGETTVSALEFTAYVAGITAGASLTQSNTGKIVEGATSIIDQLTNDEIITGLKSGQFILSANQDGSIKVEQDINSLHNYSNNLSYNFTKNRVIRTLDEIGSSIKSLWERTYLGKVSNNETGRDLFKTSITTFLQELQDKGAIQDFTGADDVSVEKGENIDAVIAEIKIKPVDSMEFLYLTVDIDN